MLFILWFVAGLSVGLIIMAFLAIASYQRGYAEGSFLRRPWRAELAARHRATINVDRREAAAASS